MLSKKELDDLRALGSVYPAVNTLLHRIEVLERENAGLWLKSERQTNCEDLLEREIGRHYDTKRELARANGRIEELKKDAKYFEDLYLRLLDIA